MISGSPPFWNLTKILRQRSSNTPILNHNGYKYVPNQEKSEILAQTFALKHSISANLGDPVTNATVHNTLESFRSTNGFYSDGSSTDFLKVSAMVKSLKHRKSPGIDGINNLCLKALPNKSLKLLTIIINACLRHSYFQREFKESKISLLSSISKILEKII